MTVEKVDKNIDIWSVPEEGLLYTGRNIHKFPINTRLEIQSDQEMMLYAVASDGTRLAILGPMASSARRFLIRRLKWDLIEVECKGLYVMTIIQC